MERPTARYRFPQSVLYAACLQVIASLRNDLPTFSNFKGKYTLAFADQLAADLAEAQAMQDFQARDFYSETARVQLTDLRRDCCDHWQFLKLYATDTPAFKGDLLKPALEAAGSTYYEAALRDFSKTRLLMQAALTFLHADNNAALLEANGQNMPPHFIQKITEATAKFEEKYSLFLQAEQYAKEQTDAKITANNDLHERVMSICADGARLYAEKPAHADRYIFDKVAGLISAAGAAGLKGTVTDAVTKKPIAGAELIIPELDKIVLTNDAGEYDFESIVAGKFQVIVRHPDYQTLDLDGKDSIKVPTGTVHTQNFSLTANP